MYDAGSMTLMKGVAHLPKENKGLEPGSPIPSFLLEDVEGKTYTAEQFRGRPFLLYFLRGTW